MHFPSQLLLALPALASALPSDYETSSLHPRAVGDGCKAPLGNGVCEDKATCPGISYPTGLCPSTPAAIQCCVEIACTVPSVGKGMCRSKANNGCSGGAFHAGACDGPNDIQCCVKNSAPSTPQPAPAAPNLCTAAKADDLVFGVPIENFLSAKSAKNPACFDWSDDGCSCSPDDLGEFNFLSPCYRHDFGYWNSKAMGRFNDAMKERIDDNFHDDLYDVCNAFSGWESYKGVECRRIADAYVFAVKHAPGKMRRGEMVAEGLGLQKRECDIFKRMMAM